MVVSLLDNKSLPQVLMTSERGSFAQKTIIYRKPQIINQVMDDNDYPPEIIDSLILFKEEIVGNNLIQPLTEDIVDVQKWNNLWDNYKKKSWLELPWYFAETFFFSTFIRSNQILSTWSFSKQGSFPKIEE